MAAAQSAGSDDDSETAEQLFMSGAISGAQEDIDTAYQFLVSTNGTPQNLPWCSYTKRMDPP